MKTITIPRKEEPKEDQLEIYDVEEILDLLKKHAHEIPLGENEGFGIIRAALEWLAKDGVEYVRRRLWEDR